jgi:4-amino-4-deoxy-L-arabinose transferase-like glycosyltransferase
LRSPHRLIPFLLLVVVYAVGSWLDVMDIDESQYASMARAMMQTNQWLRVYDRGIDYLDKPPLLFWLSGLTMKLLGVSAVTYRLIPILTSLLGLYATYRFTRLYYTERAAYLAALVWGSSYACILMNRDVRTDTMLAAWVMVAVWQGAAFFETGRLKYLLGGAVAVGLALLAKGPIGLIAPAAAFGTQVLVRRQWRWLWRWEWLLAAGVVAVILAPMCLGLYQQYGTRGLYFFFWEQSFGRITGENSWKNDVNLFFQAQNFLWSFLPWVGIAVGALIHAVGKLIRQWPRPAATRGPLPEAFSLGGFVLPFLALSTSQYQLPHYTFVVFPLMGVLSGVFLDDLFAGRIAAGWMRFFVGLQTFILLALHAVVALLCAWAFPTLNPLVWLIWGGSLLGSLYLVGRGTDADTRVFWSSFLSIVSAMLLFNGYVYVRIFEYQTGSVLGRYVREAGLPQGRVFILSRLRGNDQELYPYSFDFHANRFSPGLAQTTDLLPHLKQGDVWAYVDAQSLREVQALGRPVEIVKALGKFPVSQLRIEFLNPATRAEVLQPVYLVRVRE